MDQKRIDGQERFYPQLTGTEADLSTLPTLPFLELLKLTGWDRLPDLTQLARQPRLRRLEIDHPDITDRSPLAGLPRLQVIGSERIERLWARTPR